jgi:transposase
MMMRIHHQLLAKGIEYEDRILVHRRKREVPRQHGLPLVDRGLDAIRAMEDTAKLLDHAIDEAWGASAEAQLLSASPGVGKLTAVALVAFLSRSSDSRQRRRSVPTSDPSPVPASRGSISITAI